jgi:hypothetical protein
MVVLVRQPGKNPSLQWIERQQRQLGRSVTMPALHGASTPLADRASSATRLFSNASPIDPDQQQIQLFLANNCIAMMPPEVFHLLNLTVLSIRTLLLLWYHVRLLIRRNQIITD